jgi:hypothetical protein
MRRLFSRNAKLALAVLPVAIGCAIAKGGDPPDPILDPTAGAGGEDATGGSGMTGGTGTGGTGVSGASGSSSGMSGSSGATSGGSGGSTSTGGSGGSATGGTAGSATTGGTAGKATGGTAGSATTGGTAGTAAGGMGGTAGTAAGGKGGTAGTATGGMGGGAAGGPPGGMELFRDNFEMGTTNWSATPSGNWAIATDGSMVYSATGATASTNPWRAASAGDLTWTDVQIDARVKVTAFQGMSSGYYAGICARYQSATSFACFALRSNGQIMFRVGSSNTGATSPPGGNIVAGTWYNVRVVARGANITAFIGTGPTLTEIAASSRVTSGAPTSGRIALAAPATNAVFDDVVVTTP